MAFWYKNRTILFGSQITCWAETLSSSASLNCWKKKQELRFHNSINDKTATSLPLIFRRHRHRWHARQQRYERRRHHRLTYEHSDEMRVEANRDAYEATGAVRAWCGAACCCRSATLAPPPIDRTHLHSQSSSFVRSSVPWSAHRTDRRAFLLPPTTSPSATWALAYAPIPNTKRVNWKQHNLTKRIGGVCVCVCVDDDIYQFGGGERRWRTWHRSGWRFIVYVSRWTTTFALTCVCCFLPCGTAESSGRDGNCTITECLEDDDDDFCWWRNDNQSIQTVYCASQFAPMPLCRHDPLRQQNHLFGKLIKKWTREKTNNLLTMTNWNQQLISHF